MKTQPGDGGTAPVPSGLPTSIGPYRILGRLSQGGMGCVYEVARGEQRFAMKVPSRGALERFQRETRLGQVVNHPNICRVLDSGPDYLVMELLEGRTVRQIVAEDGAQEVWLTLSWMDQLLQALNALHTAGIVHRDLGPRNVFVTRDGVLKLMDFGLARDGAGAAITHSGAALGTPGFMSPEQMMDPRRADARSDIFGAALLMYYLLTGRRPYGRPTLKTLLRRMAQAEVDPLPELPPPLAAWLTRMLAADPAERFQTAAEAAAALPKKEDAPKPVRGRLNDLG